MKSKWICAKCKIPAEKVFLPTYAHEPGIVLQHVEAIRCPNCKEFVFDERQILKVERRTNAVKKARQKRINTG